MKLAYREYGAGKPLIILHGLFGQSDNWNTLAKSFAEQGFRVFTIDQRNHGLSPHSDIWNYEVMADDVNEFIAEHKLENPILLGHSMGGKTVMFFDKIYPKRASKIIIVDISPKAYISNNDSVLKGLNSVDFSEIKTRKEAEATLSKYISDFGTKQFLLKNIYWKESDIMAWRFNLKVINDNIDDIGSKVPFFKSTTKCLIVRGEKSHYINDNDLEDFRERFSDYIFETITGAGHWVHAEKPKEFFERVLNFIKD